MLDKHTHTLAHKCSIILELAPKHIEETKCDSTVFSLPECACARISVCAMVGPGRQLGWLGSEHSIMEAEQRDLIEVLKCWKHFLWSRAVTVGHPALSSQTGFYWTGAASAATKHRGNRDREQPGMSESDKCVFQHCGYVFVSVWICNLPEVFADP